MVPGSSNEAPATRVPRWLAAIVRAIGGLGLAGWGFAVWTCVHDWSKAGDDPFPTLAAGLGGVAHAMLLFLFTKVVGQRRIPVMIGVAAFGVGGMLLGAYLWLAKLLSHVVGL